MAHDKNTFTITRFTGNASSPAWRAAPATETDGSAWYAAITPADRQWVLYISAGGVPYLYLRADDVTDQAGDVRERYVRASSLLGELMIRVANTGVSGQPAEELPFVATACGVEERGLTQNDAVRRLLLGFGGGGPSDPLADPGVGVLAL